jgi:hypothetical protein
MYTSPSAISRAGIGPQTLDPAGEIVTGTVSARLAAAATTRATPTATAVTSPELFTEAKNLTNSAGTRYYGSRERTYEHEKFGYNVFFGVRFTL